MATGTGYNPQCDNKIRTCAELIAIRDSSKLVIDCHYRVAVPAQGNLGATTAELHAVQINELSQEAKVDTTFDNSSWSGIIDLDACKYYEIRDNIGNTVRDFPSTNNTIENFPWGNPLYLNNFIKDSTLTAWPAPAGFVADNRIENATVDFTGATTVTMQKNIISDFAAVHLNGAGTHSIQNNTIRNASTQLISTATSSSPTGLNDSILEQAFVIRNNAVGPALTSGFSGSRTRFYGHGPTDDILVDGGRVLISSSQIEGGSAPAGITIHCQSDLIAIANAELWGACRISNDPAGSQSITITQSRIMNTTLTSGPNCTETVPSNANAIGISNSEIWQSDITVDCQKSLFITFGCDIRNAIMSMPVGTVRGVEMTRSNVYTGTFLFNRTGNPLPNVTHDTIEDSNFRQRSTSSLGPEVFTVTGAGGQVASQPLVVNTTVEGGRIDIVDAIGSAIAPNLVVGDSHILDKGWLNCEPGCQLIRATRVASDAKLNTGAFNTEGSIIEGPFTKTSTADNTGSLKNASFDNWV